MQIRTEVEIEAPPARVWEVMTAFERYSEWNPFLTRVEGKAAVGEKLVVEVSRPDGRELVLETTVVRAGSNELRWRGKVYFGALLSIDHFFELMEAGRERTKLVQGQDFSGLAVKLWGPDLASAVGALAAMNQALKKRVEHGARAETRALR